MQSIKPGGHYYEEKLILGLVVSILATNPLLLQAESACVSEEVYGSFCGPDLQAACEIAEGKAKIWCRYNGGKVVEGPTWFRVSAGKYHPDGGDDRARPGHHCTASIPCCFPSK